MGVICATSPVSWNRCRPSLGEPEGRGVWGVGCGCWCVCVVLFFGFFFVVFFCPALLPEDLPFVRLTRERCSAFRRGSVPRIGERLASQDRPGVSLTLSVI